MRVLIDTDVILDVLLDREPFVETSAKLLELHERNQITGYISAITPVNVFYVVRKIRGRDAARHAVELLVHSLNLCSIDGPTLLSALTLGLTDFEDSVQCASASQSDLEAIVTRNVEDYKESPLPIYTPVQFLVLLSSNTL